MTFELIVTPVLTRKNTNRLFCANWAYFKQLLGSNYQGYRAIHAIDVTGYPYTEFYAKRPKQKNGEIVLDMIAVVEHYRTKIEIIEYEKTTDFPTVILEPEPENPLKLEAENKRLMDFWGTPPK